MITLKANGDFSKTRRWLERAKEQLKSGLLDRYGKEGVAALSLATPIDSGITADSWRYEINWNQNGTSISFHNDNINRGINIAIILQYGHGTGSGGYVQGRDYINPAIRPVFDKLAEEAWKEVTKV